MHNIGVEFVPGRNSGYAFVTRPFKGDGFSIPTLCVQASGSIPQVKISSIAKASSIAHSWNIWNGYTALDVTFSNRS
jgi:hypothetical protein